MDNHYPGVQSAVSLCRQMIMNVIFMLIASRFRPSLCQRGKGSLSFSLSLYSSFGSKEIPRHKKLYLMQFVSFVYRTKRTRSLLCLPPSLFPISSLSLYHSESMAKLCVHLTCFWGSLFDCWPSSGGSSIGFTLFDLAAAAEALPA